MRPITKGAPYQYTDGQPYSKALMGLIARLGRYCSYCERELKAGIEVEHIQPKSIHENLERRWDNFVIACKNCNSTKSKKNPQLNDWLIPDRDNTFIAFCYQEDGIIDIKTDIPPDIRLKAKKTLDLVDLNKALRNTFDEEGNLVAYDRRTERMEIWLMALRYRQYWNNAPNAQLEQAIADLARTSGFFSIWMAAFEGIPQIRRRFITEFKGTESGCFHPETTLPISPHPNPDHLPHGGKI